MNDVLRHVRWMVIVLFVLVLGLSAIVVRYNREAQHRAQRLDASVEDVRLFVEDLKTTTPEEAARNAAITKAINQVPQNSEMLARIKAILCDPSAFPDAAPCRTP